MVRRGRAVAAPARRVGGFVVLTQPSFCDSHAPRAALGQQPRALCAAIVTQGARDRARFHQRACAVAAALLTIEQGENRKPGHGRIDELLSLLRCTAGENPDPAVLSRRQFVTIAKAALAGISDRDAHLLFSAHDPRGAQEPSLDALTAPRHETCFASCGVSLATQASTALGAARSLRVCSRRTAPAPTWSCAQRTDSARPAASVSISIEQFSFVF